MVVVVAARQPLVALKQLSDSLCKPGGGASLLREEDDSRESVMTQPCRPSRTV